MTDILQSTFIPSQDWNLDFSPSTGWTGTPGSFYSGVIPAAWQDPNRTSAKPALLPLSDNGDLCFGPEDLVVGVHAYDGWALTVEVNVEGTIRTVPRSLRTWTDARGTTRSAWGYWIRLRHSLFTQDGGFLVIWRVTSADSSKQVRVLPFTYYRKPAKYSQTIRVGPSLANNPASGTAPTLNIARTYLFQQVQTLGQGSAFYQPRLLITENGDYLWTNVGDCDGVEGYLFVETDPGITATIRATNTPKATTALRIDWAGTWFKNGGATSSLKFDLDYVAQLFTPHPAGKKRSPAIEGVEIFSTTGRDTTDRVMMDRVMFTSVGAAPESGPIALECDAHDIVNAFVATSSAVRTGFALVRHCEITNIAADACQYCSNIYGLEVDTIDNTFYRTPRPALEVIYSGSGSASIQKFGGNSKPGTFTLTQTGFADVVIVLTGKSVADVVAEIASQSNWSATTLSGHAFWPAVYLHRPGTTSFGPDPTPVPVTSTPKAYDTASDTHSDVVQPGVDAFTIQNGAIINVRAIKVGSSQNIWLGGAVSFQDFYIINFAGSSNGTGSTLISQARTPLQNVNLWNISLPEQNWNLGAGASMDSYSSIRNNFFKQATVTGGLTLSGTINGHHLLVPPVPAAFSSGSSSGGTVATYMSLATFAPTSSMPAFASPALFDLNNKPRLSVTPIGAVS